MKLHDFLSLLNPGMWIRNDPTDRAWDAWINASLDKGHLPIPGDNYCFTLNGKKIWNANWPYAWGSSYLGHGLPSRMTALRLRNALVELAIASVL